MRKTGCEADYFLSGRDWSYRDFCYTNIANSWTDNRAERKKKRGQSNDNTSRK